MKSNQLIKRKKSIKKVTQEQTIERLINEEFLSASKKFPDFNSAHEGYAVILEEFEEMLEEILPIKQKMEKLWVSVKNNDQGSKQGEIIEEIRKLNIKLIKESIQFSAMIERFHQNIILPF